MKTTIRTRFILGMIFFFTIIAGISVLSSYYLNSLSKKTAGILKDNHLSVIYARDLGEQLNLIQSEMIKSYLNGSGPDTAAIKHCYAGFLKSLMLEKSNITEVGEDKLVSGIESEFQKYRTLVETFPGKKITTEKLSQLQFVSNNIFQQTILLSRMNEQAIILKANDARISAQQGLTSVTLLGSVCFIVALTFTYNFASYFNERFSRLYRGIREIGMNNFGQRLQFDGDDEFSEISEVFNQMAQNLQERMVPENPRETPFGEWEKLHQQVAMLKRTIQQIDDIRIRAVELIHNLETKT